MDEDDPADVAASLEPKPAAANRTTLARIMSLLDTNLHGNIHGGRVVPAAMDEMTSWYPLPWATW